jgi:hypothetical protein
MNSFEELCCTFNLTASEREQLAWHLGQYRARQTYLKLKEQAK